MIIKTVNGTRYNLKGEKTGLILYNSTVRLGVVTKINVSIDKRLQIFFKNGRIFSTPVNRISTVEGIEDSIDVKTSDLTISLFPKNGKVYVKFGSSEGVLLYLSAITIGQPISFVYSSLTPEGNEMIQQYSFHSSHPIEEITTT